MLAGQELWTRGQGKQVGYQFKTVLPNFLIVVREQGLLQVCPNFTSTCSHRHRSGVVDKRAMEAGRGPDWAVQNRSSQLLNCCGSTPLWLEDRDCYVQVCPNFSSICSQESWTREQGKQVGYQTEWLKTDLPNFLIVVDTFVVGGQGLLQVCLNFSSKCRQWSGVVDKRAREAGRGPDWVVQNRSSQFLNCCGHLSQLWLEGKDCYKFVQTSQV